MPERNMRCEHNLLMSLVSSSNRFFDFLGSMSINEIGNVENNEKITYVASFYYKKKKSKRDYPSTSSIYNS